MGFENRKSLRVPLATQVCFWEGEIQEGRSHWGHGGNLSATGMAFSSAEFVPKGAIVQLELSLPEQRRPLRLSAKVIACQRDEGPDARCQIRVAFLNLDSEDRHLIRLYVLQVAEPGMGWARAFFPGLPAIDAKYRELAAVDAKLWLQQKAYLSIRELAYLKRFQSALEALFGSKSPDSFKLSGSRQLKDECDVWIEFDLPDGQWHFLAKALWCRQEKGEKAECGLKLTAFNKDEAVKIEKGS